MCTSDDFQERTFSAVIGTELWFFKLNRGIIIRGSDGKTPIR